MTKSEPTITTGEADAAAHALLGDVLDDDAQRQWVWYVARTAGDGSRGELEVFITVLMFGNALLRVREACGQCEPWEEPSNGR